MEQTFKTNWLKFCVYDSKFNEIKLVSTGWIQITQPKKASDLLKALSNFEHILIVVFGKYLSFFLTYRFVILTCQNIFRSNLDIFWKAWKMTENRAKRHVSFHGKMTSYPFEWGYAAKATTTACGHAQHTHYFSWMKAVRMYVFFRTTEFYAVLKCT